MSALLVVLVGFVGMFNSDPILLPITLVVAAVFIALEFASPPSSDPLFGIPIPQRMQNSLAVLQDASQHYITSDKRCAIAINEEAKKICFVTPQDEAKRISQLTQLVESYKKEKGVERVTANEIVQYAAQNSPVDNPTVGVNVRNYDFRDILSVEIVEDGHTITKTSRSSQVAGAILGGIVAGGVGAVIGGLSGQTSSHNRVTRIDLKIIVNDTKSPIYTVNFLNLATTKGSWVYKPAMELANHWHALLSVLIKQADQEDKAVATSQQVATQHGSQSISVADELKKLVDLRDAGVLSQAEFDAAKNKLLNSL